MRPAGRALLFAAATALLPAAARAGGYDTPMLYSARHMGMGGTAIGYVNDPSAMFHNPAGLAHTRGWSVLGDATLLLAKVRSSPTPFNKDIWSRQTVAPLGLLGGGFRLNETVTVGLGVYPIALAGARYRYPGPGGTTDNVENRTQLVFLEISPAFALNLPGRVRLGAGYRATYVSLTRYQGDPTITDMLQLLDFKVTGWNWLGFRVGAQWSPLDWLQVGAVYRHKTSTKVTNDQGVALGMRFTDLETTFVLPAKAGLGLRADFWHFGLAVDGEYLFNSQNDAYPLQGVRQPTQASPTAEAVAVPNAFYWKDEIVVRAGLELRLAAVKAIAPLSVRGGYIYDGKTTQERYPSAFGTPPGPTHVITAGLGWNGGPWQLNAAFARRVGEGEVRPGFVAPESECRFCGSAGNLPYKITVNGFYLDFSYAL
jgi:long-chain fatty acid transport protein